MSKIAIISDIHSNLFYFEKVLEVIEKLNVDKIYCLGDLVGYYDKPNEVIELVIKKNIISVVGNHEKYLLGKLNYNSKNESIYGIKNQRKIITKKNLDFLKSLPEKIEFTNNLKKFYLTHSLPNDVSTYVYELKNLDKNFISQYDYYCFGHTHIPVISYKYGTCVINPGSIGQPRDFTRTPSFVIVNLDNDMVSLKKINVNFKKYSKNLINSGYDYRLTNILNRTKNG